MDRYGGGRGGPDWHASGGHLVGGVDLTPLDQRAGAILRRLPNNARMAEIGVLRGALSDCLLRGAPGLRLVMVDNWLTADQQPEAYRATRDDHALHADAGRVAAHRRDAIAVADRHAPRATIIEGWSVRVAEKIEPASFDLVFLDADHSEEGVRADIAAWLPKVKPGGWIGGHDYGNDDPRFDFSGVKRAVDAWVKAPEMDANFTWWARV